MEQFLNPYVQCPFNKAHQVPKLRLQYHIVKCRKSFENTDKRVCPYNATHIVSNAKFAAHLMKCPDGRLLEAHKYNGHEGCGDMGNPSFYDNVPFTYSWEEENNAGAEEMRKGRENGWSQHLMQRNPIELVEDGRSFSDSRFQHNSVKGCTKVAPQRKTYALGPVMSEDDEDDDDNYQPCMLSNKSERVNTSKLKSSELKCEKEDYSSDKEIQKRGANAWGDHLKQVKSKGYIEDDRVSSSSKLNYSNTTAALRKMPSALGPQMLQDNDDDYVPPKLPNKQGSSTASQSKTSELQDAPSSTSIGKKSDPGEAPVKPVGWMGMGRGRVHRLLSNLQI